MAINLYISNTYITYTEGPKKDGRMYGWGVWGGSCYRKGFTPNYENNKAINENYAVVTAKYGDNKPMPAIPKYESIFPSVATHALVSKKNKLGAIHIP